MRRVTPESQGHIGKMMNATSSLPASDQSPQPQNASSAKGAERERGSSLAHFVLCTGSLQRLLCLLAGSE